MDHNVWPIDEVVHIKWDKSEGDWSRFNSDVQLNDSIWQMPIISQNAIRTPHDTFSLMPQYHARHNDIGKPIIHGLVTYTSKSSSYLTNTEVKWISVSICSHWSEWVCRVLCPIRHTVGHFRDESFQAINCTGTNNQKTIQKHKRETEKLP